MGEVITLSATAVIGESREVTIADRLEVLLDGGFAKSVVGTEPEGVPVRATRDARNVIVGVESEAFGASRSGEEL